MTGILIALGLALLAALALKLGARLSLAEMAAPVATMVLALAGYAWQGHPDLAGHPAQARETVRFDERLAEKRRAIGERMGPASKWLVMSDGLARQGDTQDAANILTAGLKELPNDPDLWVGLGNALLAHGGGRLSPASNYAYAQALALAPEAISPRYFYGLALGQTGSFAAAKQIWGELAGRLPEDADLRAELVRNMAILDSLIAQGEAPEMAQAPPGPESSAP
jgi:cytochrome c-type biogenesis protein CcmH